MKKETARKSAALLSSSPLRRKQIETSLLATDRTARKECLAIVNAAWNLAEFADDAHAMSALERVANHIRATILEDENG